VSSVPYTGIAHWKMIIIRCVSYSSICHLKSGVTLNITYKSSRDANTISCIEGQGKISPLKYKTISFTNSEIWLLVVIKVIFKKKMFNWSYSSSLFICKNSLFSINIWQKIPNLSFHEHPDNHTDGQGQIHMPWPIKWWGHKQ